MKASAPWTVAPMIGVLDVAKAVRYYETTLGFVCRPESIYGGVGDEGPVYAIVRREGVALHLQIRRRPLVLEMREAHEGDAYLYVSDVDALYDEYKAKGVKIHRELQDEPYGVRDFTLETPDGHRIAFGTAMDEPATRTL
jgi:uncharacterized glyoxalase superfamily protein PhnB